MELNISLVDVDWTEELGVSRKHIPAHYAYFTNEST